MIFEYVGMQIEQITEEIKQCVKTNKHQSQRKTSATFNEQQRIQYR